MSLVGVVGRHLGGQKARGWWQFVSLDEPSRLEFEDGFSDESGAPDASMPTIQVRVDLEEAGPAPA
jgi:hypothetical protein